jgi:hypothetical protein
MILNCGKEGEGWEETGIEGMKIHKLVMHVIDLALIQNA